MKTYYKYLFTSKGVSEEEGETFHIERLFFMSTENLRLSYLERKMKFSPDPFTPIVDNGTIARSGYDVATQILVGADIAPIYRVNDPYAASHSEGPGGCSYRFISGVLKQVSTIDAISDGVSCPAEFMLRKKIIEAVKALIEAEEVE